MKFPEDNLNIFWEKVRLFKMAHNMQLDNHKDKKLANKMLRYWEKNRKLNIYEYLCSEYKTK